ncbi:MAG TPA: class I SAM-dependent methyltransferase [Burkholderiales bacterium]|nr:class I SAM-dependent methyltransferase [Burkholderiales bacterium]
MPAARYIQTCPVGCATSLEVSGIVLAEGPLLRCPECGQLISQCSEVRYWQSMQEFDDPRGTLPSVDSDKRRSQQNAKWLTKISRRLQKPAAEIHLLDVGCSSGAFLSIARQLDFRAEGVEPAPKAAQSALQSGLKVHTGTLEEAGFPADHFDAITLFEVIEHIKEPLPLLKECRRIIRPNGVLMIGTGNNASWTAAFMKSRWQYFQIDHHGGHVSFFNPLSLRLLAERCGFTLCRLETRNVRFYEKGDVPALPYRLAKIAAEMLNIPARLLGTGHDLLALLRPR